MDIMALKNSRPHKANFYRKEYVSSSFPIKVIGAIAMVAGIICFVWFGIITRYAEVSSLKSILREEESNLEAINNKLNSYVEIEDDYLRYSKDYMSTDERSIVSRSIALDIVDKYLLSSCDVSKLQITDNEILTTLNNASLATASAIIDEMNADGDNYVKYATTKNARNELNSDVPLVEMTINLSNGQEEVIDFE